MDVQLALPPGRERLQEPGHRGVSSTHAAASYGTKAGAFGVPRERLWLRAAALGADLLLLVGGPLLLATVVTVAGLVIDPDATASFVSVLRSAQAAALVLFLARDRGGASPGKRFFGLEVRRQDGRPATLLDSIARNAPLCVPFWNLFEAISVLRRPDGRRPGDRASRTTVGEA